jgi:hypothetical protein
MSFGIQFLNHQPRIMVVKKRVVQGVEEAKTVRQHL